ncbi:MAG TPA: hypothetical protein VF426_04660 [Marmoricola sp.]
MAGTDPDDGDLQDLVVRAAWVAAMDGCGGDCDSFLPGHDVHWIQARKAMEEPARPALVVAVDGHRMTLLFEDGSSEVVWHHRELSEHVEVGQRAWRHEHGILRLPGSGLGTPMLCVRPEGQPEGCAGEDCYLVAPGHAVTYIAARLHRQARPFVVTVERIDGKRGTLRFLDTDTTCEVRWHRPLSTYLVVGGQYLYAHPGVLRPHPRLPLPCAHPGGDSFLVWFEHLGGESLDHLDPGG